MAAMEWARLRSKLQGLVNSMDDETEKNDHFISTEMYNKMVDKISTELNDLKPITDIPIYQ